MTWFKVDDGFWSHPKTATLSDTALALWVRSGSYCCQHLTDGSVPLGALRLLGVKSAADELVAASLWDSTDEGWQFHDWEEYQPSRDSVLTERASNAARQAVARNPELRDAVRQRDTNNCRYCGQPVEWNNRRGGSGGTYDHVNPKGPSTFENLVVCCRACNTRKGRRTPAQAGMKLISVEPESDSNRTQVEGSSRADYPTRPDPTRPPTNSTSANAEVGAPRKSARRTKIRDGYKPEPHIGEKIHTEFPAIPNETLREVHEDFCLYWQGQGKPMADWDATWLRWMRKELPKHTVGRTNGSNVTAFERKKAANAAVFASLADPTPLEIER